MSYRFVKVTSFYPKFLNSFYSQNPEATSKNYNDQMKILMNTGFGWSDFYASHLKELGVQAYEIVANAESLQRAWAVENHSFAKGRDLVLEQLKTLRPQVVFIQDTPTFNGEWVRQLRDKIPSIKLIFGWICAPYREDQIDLYKPFDTILTCSEGFQEDLGKLGLSTYCIRHGFEQTLLPRIIENNHFQESDLLFSGSLIPGSHFHDERIEFLENLLNEKVNVHIHADLEMVDSFKLRAKQAAFLAAQILKTCHLENVSKIVPMIDKASQWPQFPEGSHFSRALRQSIHPPLFGVEMLQALHKAKISFNMHIEAAKNYAANMRIFEVTGSGSCLITDWKPNIRDLFEPDKEIVTYKTEGECIEKIKWLLAHPQERSAIAEAGQRRCLKDHTYKDRANRLHQFILKNL